MIYSANFLFMCFIQNMLRINSLDKSFKYDGKILLKGARKYTGNFFTTLDSGKKLFLDYEKGLLKSASSGNFNNIRLRTYEYDKNGRLINVKKDGKDVFVKEIKHNIGLEYTREEKINDVIGKTFDVSGRLIKYVVSPKLIFGFIKYFDNISVDTRYFLNQANYTGAGRIQLRYLQGDPILNNGVVDKTIIRDLKHGGMSVIVQDGHNFKGIYTDAAGQTRAELNYLVDKNGNPIWTRIKGDNNQWSYDKKTMYDNYGNKIREIFSECDGKWFTENTFDNKGNIIQSRRLGASGKNIQTSKYVYNKDNLLIKESVYNQNDKLIEQTINSYYPNKSLKISLITYYDSLGSYKNIYEYDKNNNLIKFSEIYEDVKMETFYDKNDLITKYVEKDSKDNVKFTKDYINDESGCIKTIVKDAKGTEIYHIEHLKQTLKDIFKSINIFKTPGNKLIGKEFIIHNDDIGETKYFYTNQNGKRVNYVTLCKLLGDEV